MWLSSISSNSVQLPASQINQRWSTLRHIGHARTKGAERLQITFFFLFLFSLLRFQNILSLLFSMYVIQN